MREENKKMLDTQIAIYEQKKKEIDDLIVAIHQTEKDHTQTKKQAEETPTLKVVQQLANLERLFSVQKNKLQVLQEEYKQFVIDQTASLLAFGQRVQEEELSENEQIQERFIQAAHALNQAIEKSQELQDEYYRVQADTQKELRKLKPYMDPDNLRVIGFPRAQQTINLPSDSDISKLKDLQRALNNELKVLGGTDNE